MKYKVGDEVIVRLDLIKDALYGKRVFACDMLRFKGEKVKISHVFNHHYLIHEDKGDWAWTDEMFEKISIPQPHKSLLKSGMKVVYRNGSHRYVLLETNGLYNPYTCNFSLPISEYNENLIRASDISSPYDIMKIYDGEMLIAKREEKSTKDTKIEELEKRMRDLADEFLS